VAARLSTSYGLAHDHFILRRTRATAVLRAMNPRQRARAVAGAFAIDHSRADGLRGRHVLLVDDVRTSGATTDAYTHTLLRGGAAKVTILCWARVFDDHVD